ITHRERLGRRDQATPPVIEKGGHRRKPLSDGFDIDHHHNIWYGQTAVNPYLTLSKLDSIICGRGPKMRYLDVVVGPRGGADVYRVTRDRPNVGFWEEGMRFGFFDQLPCAPGYSEPQRYKDIIAQIELGDVVGFDTAWLGEIHFIREFSILADTLMVLAAAAQRTSRIRLGTAVTLLALPRPIKIAEEA